MKEFKKITLVFFILMCMFSFVLVKANSGNAAVLNDSVSIRSKTETSRQGLRFTAELKDLQAEHGFYVAYGKVSLNDLKSAINNPVGGKIIINDKEVFKVAVESVDNDNNFKVVLVGIPDFGYFDQISVFAYADNFISANVTKSVLDVAVKMEESNASSSTSKDIINSFENIFLKGKLDSNLNYVVSSGIYTNQNKTNFIDFNNYELFLKDDGLMLPIPTKEGFNFKGYYDNENYSGTVVTKATLSKTYYAKWEPLEYSISFNLNDGTWPTITKAGYTNREKMITDFLTEFYQFLKPEGLSLNDFMHGDGKTNGFDGSYNTYIASLRKISDKAPSSDATTFVNLPENQKWIPLIDLMDEYTGLNAAQVGQFWSSNWTAESRFKQFILKENLWGTDKQEAVNNLTNKIPDELAASSTIQVEVPSSYNLESDEIVLPIPEKSNYDFLGWYDNPTFAGNTVTKINKGSSGNKIFYARWGESVMPDPNDEKNPEFVFTNDYEEVMVVNWNKTYDPLKGVNAVDIVDGNITNNIVVTNTIDNKSYGRQYVTLKITNSRGKTTTLTRAIEVVWNYDVTFVGHAGSYYGLMNSEEAILYAIQVLKYQAIEVDLKQTKDDVFILCHDDTFGGKTLKNENWSTLKNVKVTEGRSSGIPASNGSITNSPYTTGLLTLERYLEICKQYNVKCVIELKYSNGITNIDQSRMQALMDVIESKGMLNEVIFLGSQYNCLIWTRNNGYEYIPCQYLVSSIESETFLQRCIDYNLDISFNVTGANSDAWMNRYRSHGIKIACYTFSQYSDYPLLQSYINRGVDYVTCDWHIMSNLTLPESGTPVIPDVPEPGTYSPVPWASKQAFIDEFYGDFYNWLKAKGSDLANVTVNGNTININQNGKNVTINSVADLKAVNISDFEPTFGTLIYAPFNRVGTSAVYPNLNENYFLNSSNYRDKYQDLDGYFLNAILNNYTSYDNGYNQASGGRVQIFFRFHQWQQGTNIPQFNSLPQKYVLN